MTGEKAQVLIERELYERAKRYVEQQGTFSSVDELVEFLLRQLLEEQQGEVMSREEEEAVKDRLRRLGYL
ncbi:MAG: CopG family transcriptional regulator [Acidilobus sp.]|nr:CopG family transcriptional regulator [Acidilobus sp.]MCG2890292.1 CopG family transcriptional regulator [Acidilobus sp.]MCG2891164.1 CopG family transcriptional regulator [Acidilobus sp.]